MVEKSAVQTVLEEMCYQRAKIDVRSYSGRAMYGEQCLGVTVDRYDSPERLLAKMVLFCLEDPAFDPGDPDEDAAAQNRVIEICRAFRNSHTDNEGRGTVIGGRRSMTAII